MGYDHSMAEYQASSNVSVVTSDQAAERIGGFLRSVYGWMCAGLGITAVTAAFVAASPSLVVAIAKNSLLFWGLIIAQFGIVFALSGRVERMATSTASALFIVYSVLTGITLSFVLLAYTGESVASTFVVTAGMFGALAGFGTLTRKNLAGWGQFLFMGLIGVVLASLVGIFWQNDALQFATAFVGVVVFTGLTAYDAQRLKAMALAVPEGQAGSYAIVGALALYLDFVNLFLMLLRLFGGRRR
jgi:FtsH-binding integral membrane protein